MNFSPLQVCMNFFEAQKTVIFHATEFPTDQGLSFQSPIRKILNYAEDLWLFYPGNLGSLAHQKSQCSRWSSPVVDDSTDPRLASKCFGPSNALIVLVPHYESISTTDFPSSPIRTSKNFLYCLGQGSPFLSDICLHIMLATIFWQDLHFVGGKAKWRSSNVEKKIHTFWCSECTCCMFQYDWRLLAT